MYGFFRETSEKALKEGIDKATGICRTGLDEYLCCIFPNINDWQHDKTTGIILNGKKCLKRPDYRSENLKIIIEFDGLPHYQNPDIILKDYEDIKLYESFGYKVIRIPYFIQLSKSAVKTLFNIDLDYELFDKSIPSLSVESRNTPAYLCPTGIQRMRSEFQKFPIQYKINLDYLRSLNNDFLTGVSLLET